jgi:hypothetical protein
VLKAVLSRYEVAPGSAALELNRRRAITISPGRGAEAVLRARERAPQQSPVAVAA